MSTIKSAILCVTAAIIFVLIKGENKTLVNPDCLNCLCEASSQCNASIGCYEPYSGSNFCGAFGISWLYWSEAGKPIIRDDDPTRKSAYENCVKDLYCASQTVHQYMNKFLNNGDCNGDGIIDCADFARMHNEGGYACNTPATNSSDYYVKFEECWGKVKKPVSRPA